MRRLVAALVVVGAFAVVAISSAAADTSSTIPFHPRIGNIFGMIPPLDTSNGQVSNQAPASGSLYYNGGPVMTTNTVYAIYGQPPGYQFPSGYMDNINGFFRNLQADNGKNTNTYDNASTFSDAGVTSGLGSATANASGQFSLTTKVPAKAAAGTATVTSTGSSGSASAAFTVPSP
jgi:hypothetical protein